MFMCNPGARGAPMAHRMASGKHPLTCPSHHTPTLPACFPLYLIHNNNMDSNKLFIKFFPVYLILVEYEGRHLACLAHFLFL